MLTVLCDCSAGGPEEQAGLEGSGQAGHQEHCGAWRARPGRKAASHPHAWRSVLRQPARLSVCNETGSVPATACWESQGIGARMQRAHAEGCALMLAGVMLNSRVSYTGVPYMDGVVFSGELLAYVADAQGAALSFFRT